MNPENKNTQIKWASVTDKKQAAVPSNVFLVLKICIFPYVDPIMEAAESPTAIRFNPRNA